jgi:glyoxylase-like metal-dependent hydrolase (beta-lactamase superfamily II)
MPRSRDIAPRVHRLGSSTVNWYLVEDQGRFTAVDAGLPGFRRSLEQDLAALGVASGDVTAVILTHSDADHIGLARTLQAQGARILIHQADEATLRKPGAKGGDASPAHIVSELWRPSLWRFAISMVASGGGRMRGVEGAEVFSDEQILEVPGRPRVIPTHGHTPGHCAFHFEDHRALFVGDAMCSLNPVTGQRGPQLMPRAMNVSNEQALRSLDALEPIDADIMLFGHGEPWREGVGAAVRMARERAAI